jgi:ribosomal protein S18 acetylase RimI-like enzyme
MKEEPAGFCFMAGPHEARNSYVMDQLRAFNQARSPAPGAEAPAPPPAVPIEIYVLDSEQTVIGGLIGRTHSIPYWLEISVLWVHEASRGQGLGRQLVQQAEQEAAQRDCRYARLATSDFQAPGFYEKLGYVRYGVLENCPPGVTVHYFQKDLTRS